MKYKYDSDIDKILDEMDRKRSYSLDRVEKPFSTTHKEYNSDNEDVEFYRYPGSPDKKRGITRSIISKKV